MNIIKKWFSKKDKPLKLRIGRVTYDTVGTLDEILHKTSKTKYFKRLTHISKKRHIIPLCINTDEDAVFDELIVLCDSFEKVEIPYKGNGDIDYMKFPYYGITSYRYSKIYE
jgi:hypothetical protein